ncbi:MAG TPA: carbonate dehydratase [Pyrinomonadaceae bacterium]|jgi:carbonic anhydrase|nr:carbonate dehydratase [Pyrinomonadaceae bacterium]
MRKLKSLFENNRAWAEEIRSREPEFFRQLARQQSPQYLWVGCSDSRVPATQLAGLSPGEMFVHRNVANLVVHTDLNCLSVMQYAVEVLKVSHIIVCGHYGCGGVQAALSNSRFGLIDNWLRHVQDVAEKHATALARAANDAERLHLLCELNVREQFANACRTTVVQEAWGRGQPLAVHGWVYGLDDGLLRDLRLCATCPEDLATEAAAGET